MKLNFNSNAVKTLRAYKKNILDHSKNINNISTGKKINSSKDNPNHISKLGNFEREIRGYQASRRNIQDTVSMIQAADGVLDSVGNRITRIRELSVELGNASIGEDEKNILGNEINTLLEGIDYEIKNFSFNGINVLGHGETNDNSNPQLVEVLTTSKSGEVTEIPLFNLSIESLGIKDFDVNDDLSSILGKVDNAFSEVVSARSKLGAIGNTLEDKIKHSENLEEAIVGSKSKIEDSDIALEMMEFSRTLILTESNIKNMSKTIYFPNDMINIFGKLYK